MENNIKKPYNLEEERKRFREHLLELREKAQREKTEFEAKNGKVEPIMKKVWASDYDVVIEW